MLKLIELFYRKRLQSTQKKENGITRTLHEADRELPLLSPMPDTLHAPFGTVHTSDLSISMPALEHSSSHAHWERSLRQHQSWLPC